MYSINIQYKWYVRTQCDTSVRLCIYMSPFSKPWLRFYSLRLRNVPGLCFYTSCFPLYILLGLSRDDETDVHVLQSCLVPASPGVSSWTSQTLALSLSLSDLSKSLTEPSLIGRISSDFNRMCSFRVTYWKLEHRGPSLGFSSFVLYLFISQLTMKH